MSGLVTRFAPSPTGRLHLGHAFSALTAWDLARAAGGTFLLRIEDIDRTRARPDHEAAILDDLAWLGLAWPEPVLRQSERLPAYAAALDRLKALGVAYPCTCTRRDIAAALAAPQEGAPAGVYPGTCRGRTDAPEDAAWRLDLAAATHRLGGPAAVAGLGFTETGPQAPGAHRLDPDRLAREIGDVVLGRRDTGIAYHLAVVIDDAAQGVTHVVRGADLLAGDPAPPPAAGAPRSPGAGLAPPPADPRRRRPPPRQARRRPRPRRLARRRGDPRGSPPRNWRSLRPARR